MNAKKIMGAVLVALLAAALFVGAGAAADASVDGKTIFFYQVLDTKYEGTWNNGANSFTIANGAMYVSNTALPEGKYSYNDSVSVYLKKPTAVVTGTAIDPTAGSSDAYQIIGGTVYTGDTATIKLVSAASNTSVNITGVFLTGPNGVPKDATAYITAGSNTNSVTLTIPTTASTAAGEYKLTAVFGGTNVFAAGTPDDAKESGVLGTFTVAKADDVTVTAAAETVIVGEPVAVTITGKPGITFHIEGDFAVESQGTVSGSSSAGYTMPNTGKAVLYMNCTSKDSGNGKITVVTNKGNPVTEKKTTITLSIKKGTITAATEKDSYYVGDDVKVTGTATAGISTIYVYIEGTNIGLQNLTSSGSVITIAVNGNGEWEKKLDKADLKKKSGQKLDAGTYTLYFCTYDPAATSTTYKTKDLGTYGTAVLIMKQPFVTVTDAPSIAVKGTDFVVKGTAEATDDLAVYVFGTNFYAANNGTNTVVGSTVLGDSPVSFDKTEFTIEFEIPETGMAAGQYFMVIQHPMYDGYYNIAPNSTGAIVLNATGQADQTPATDANTLFDVYERQTSNAAQALCDELDSQSIDDMYVKLSFVVAGPTSTINPIPSEITKGSKLTVSGTTNLAEGELVTVEMLSTAFAAVPKETVGSASFIALTTTTDENGNWEVTFDTSSLNVDEYTVSVAVASLDSTSTKINVIEGAPTEQPTENPTEQPTQTQQPTEAPTTPGFGTLAALAGLGAVAVLLLRRE